MSLASANIIVVEIESLNLNPSFRVDLIYEMIFVFKTK